MGVTKRRLLREVGADRRRHLWVSPLPHKILFIIRLFTSSSLPWEKIFCLFVFLVGFVVAQRFFVVGFFFFFCEVVLGFFFFMLSR